MEKTMISDQKEDYIIGCPNSTTIKMINFSSSISYINRENEKNRHLFNSSSKKADC